VTGGFSTGPPCRRSSPGPAQEPRADILVRPQDVEIAAEGQVATVLSVLFEGERYALRLALPDGQALRAFSRQPVKVGDRLSIVIRAAWRL
jgi:iron(III) transport system ATP-binding protein